jgi:hypothetical protein
MEDADQRGPHLTGRQAVEFWLRCQGLIEVSIHPEPVVPFCPGMAG